MNVLVEANIIFKKFINSNFLVLSFIALVTFSLYYPSLNFDFTYLDDYDLVIKKNHILRQIENLPLLFTTKFFMTESGVYYRPMISLSFMIDALIGGTKPFIYHFSNCIYHILGSFLFFLLLKRFVDNKSFAFALTLIFIIHPLNVQTTAWIPGRNDSILFIFIALTFLSYLKVCEKNLLKYHILMSLSFWGALLSKENAPLVIPMILLYYYLIQKNSVPKNFILIVLIQLSLIFVLWLVLYFLSVGDKIITEGMQLKTFDYVLGALNYIGKIVLPLNLSVITLKDNINFTYGMIVLILFVVLSFSGIKRKETFIFGMFWFFIFLFSGMVGFAGFTNFLDNRAYVPLFGFALAISQLKIFDKLDNLVSVSLVLIQMFVFSFLTFNHLSNFRDGLTFHKSAVKSSPESFFTRRGLANIYHRLNNFHEAEKEYLKSLSLNPNSIETLNNLALNYKRMNNFNKAEYYLLQAIKFNPENKVTLNNLANLYLSMNEYEKSENLFLQSLKLDPKYFEVYNNLGVLYAKTNRDSLALYHFKKSIELNPFFMEAYLNLALFYYNRGKADSSRYFYKLALKNGLSLDNPFDKLFR